MADKTEAQRWIDRIRRTEKINKDRREECIRYKKAYTGDFQNSRGNDVNKYTVRVNFIYYFVETILATVFNGEPKVRGKVTNNPAFQKAAELLAYNVNYWIKELDGKAEFHDAIFDSFFGPTAIYVGWDYQTEIVDELDPLTGLPVKAEKILKDQPLIRWLDFYEEVRVDPDVKRTRRARWMAVRITVPYAEFLEMENILDEYKEGDKALKPTIRPEDMKTEDMAYQEDRRYEKSDPEWISFWEVWDREKMERKYIHESCDKPINKDISWPYEMEVKDDPFPITILHAKTDPFGPMSNSEFKPLEDQIWERVRVRSVQAAIIRRIAPKYLYEKGAGTKEQINKLQKSDILSANELNSIGKFQMMPVPEIPQGFYQWDSQLAEDLGNSSGLTEFENNSLANTATEASIAEGRSTVRRSKRTAQIEDFVVTVLKKIGQLCQQLQVRETTFVISGDELGEVEDQVFSVSKEKIQGEFDFELIAGSMSWVNEETEKRDLLKFLEIANNSGEINVREIMARVADLFSLNPKKVMLSDEQKAEMSKATAEPTLKFAPIKMEDMNPVDRLRVVESAKKENQVSSLTPEPRQAAEAAMGAVNGREPPNTSIPMNDSQNLVNAANPAVAVHPSSMTNDR